MHETYERVGSVDAELKTYLDALRQDLTQQIAESRQHAEQLNQETRNELMAHTDRRIKDTMAHTDQRINETHVLMEDLRHDLQGVAEGVLTVNQKLDRYMADTDKRLTRLEHRLP